MTTRLTVLLTALLPAVSLADARITLRHADMGTEGTYQELQRSSPDHSSSVLSVRAGKVLMESENSADGTVLFDAATGTLTVVDHAEKAYMQIDDAAVEGMQDQMREVMKQMEEQMAGMSEEQRAMMKKYMPGMPVQEESAPSYSVEDGGGNDEVAGVRCRKVTILRNGAAEHEGCISTAKEMGIAREDYETLAAMFEKMQSMSSKLTRKHASMPSLRSIGGMPVKMRDLQSGSISMLESVNTGSLDPALFEIPATYTARAMPRM